MTLLTTEPPPIQSFTDGRRWPKCRASNASRCSILTVPRNEGSWNSMPLLISAPLKRSMEEVLRSEAGAIRMGELGCLSLLERLLGLLHLTIRSWSCFQFAGPIERIYLKKDRVLYQLRGLNEKYQKDCSFLTRILPKWLRLRFQVVQFLQ